jgi:hypothetical protein
VWREVRIEIEPAPATADALALKETPGKPWRYPQE